MVISQSTLPPVPREQMMAVFNALEALLAAVNQSFDLDTILNEALDEIMRLFQCHSTHIRLLDFAAQELIIAAHRGYSAADLAHLKKRRKYGEGLSVLPIASGEALIVTDINTDPRYGARQGFARQIGVRSFIYFPLRAKGKVLGDIVVHYARPHAYAPEAVRLFVAIGHLIGAAIANARSHREQMEEIAERKRVEAALRSSEEEARCLAQENKVIAEIGRIISSSLNIDEVYERFAEEVRKLISLDRITINIFNPGDNTVTNAYVSGTALPHRKKGIFYPSAFTITEEVRHTRTSVLINEENYQNYLDRFPGFALSFQAGFRSLMVVPLISQDEVIGVLQFRHTKPSTYAEKDLKLAERVGSQISRVIANAQLLLDRKKSEEARKESEAKYYDLYNNAPDMYYSLDFRTGAIRECNETFIRTTGYSKEELIGRPIFELYDSGSVDDAKKSFQQFPVTGEVHDAERRVKCKDGHIIHVSLNVSAIRDKDGNITYSRSIWRDITQRKEYEELIRALSITDQLTGLYNRRGFTTLAEQQLRMAERTRNGIVLLFADVDGLKQINDKLGHKSGDAAIAEAAHVLQEVFRKMDIIARMGGDEFAVLAPEASVEYAEMIRHRLQDQLAAHNSRAGRDYHLSLSIGMVYHDPSTPSSLDELISRADSLMYEQKQWKVPLDSPGKQRYLIAAGS